MAEKKIVRKVISKAPSAVKKTEEVTLPAEETQKEGIQRETGRIKKVCFFDQSKTEPTYTNTAVLRRFVTDRAKIVARAKSNLCSKHQRELTRQIKYARHLALLPFVPKV